MDADAQADIAEAAADRRRQARSRGGVGPGGGGGPIATSTYNRPVLDADAQADIAEAAANRKRRERGGGGGAGGGGGEGRGGPKADSAYKKPRLNADALADQPEVAANRKSANQKSKRPDSATPKKQKSEPGFSSTQTATNQQTTSVDQIQMDPAVMNSVKNLAHAHGAETFSVSRTVRKEEPTSIAKPSPMAMDALYNDFVTFMSERLKREPNTVHKSVLPEQLPETDPAGISLVKPKSVNHKPTIQLHPKHKLAFSAIDNTKSSYQENVPSSNIQSTHKKQSDPKKQLDKSIRTKRKKVNALTTSSEMGNNNAVQIQTIANAEAVITEKKKSSKGSNTQIRTSSQTSLTPHSGTESKSLPDLSALQNIASFFTNNVVPKLDRSNQQPNFVFVMINSQSVPNPISQSPILSAVSKSSTPNLQNTAVKDHTNKIISAIAENNKAGIKTETPTADKSIYDKHILETHAHNEANLASAGRHIGSHRKASTGAADMRIHTGPQTNRFGPREVHVGHASGTARGTPAFGEVHVGHARGTTRGASDFGEVHIGHTRGTARGPSAFGEVHVGHARGAPAFGEVHLGHARGTARGPSEFVPEPGKINLIASMFHFIQGPQADFF